MLPQWKMELKEQNSWQKAETMAKDTVELIKENLPEKLDSVKLAFNDFSKSCNLSFSV